MVALMDTVAAWKIECASIGDSLAPGTLAAAIHSSHLAAREFDEVQYSHL